MSLNIKSILKKAGKKDFLTIEEALFLYQNSKLEDIVSTALKLRNCFHNNKVTYIIDRNVNITNICISACKICNFYCIPKSGNAYITGIDEYKTKIKELYELGGKQLLLQGGLNPALKIDFYINLFRSLKRNFPDLKLHALSPPEIIFISKNSGLSVKECLKQLIEAGLDSLPGGGAEILVDRVRNIISTVKCNSVEWLNVMKEAHKLNITTSATMMFGHVETDEEIVEHLIKIRDAQNEKPANSKGFISFTPWPFQSENTRLKKQFPEISPVKTNQYIRIIALSRILLPNITNIQASWLTVGYDAASKALMAGANDLGSIMIEENVVSSAGAEYKINKEQMEKLIQKSGFIPALRDQQYNVLY